MMEKKRRSLGIPALFVVGLALAARGIAGLCLFALPSRSVGAIGGADGPTVIFVTGPGMENFPTEWISLLLTWGPAVLLVLGLLCCLAGGLLLAKRRKK